MNKVLRYFATSGIKPTLKDELQEVYSAEIDIFLEKLESLSKECQENDSGQVFNVIDKLVNEARFVPLEFLEIMYAIYLQIRFDGYLKKIVEEAWKIRDYKIDPSLFDEIAKTLDFKSESHLEIGKSFIKHQRNVLGIYSYHKNCNKENYILLSSLNSTNMMHAFAIPSRRRRLKIGKGMISCLVKNELKKLNVPLNSETTAKTLLLFDLVNFDNFFSNYRYQMFDDHFIAETNPQVLSISNRVNYSLLCEIVQNSRGIGSTRRCCLCKIIIECESQGNRKNST